LIRFIYRRAKQLLHAGCREDIIPAAVTGVEPPKFLIRVHAASAILETFAALIAD
jgi:hypothetical protein